MLSPEFVRLQRAVAGRYSLVEELGRGGMGVVFAARDVALDRPVAIKLLPPAMGDSEDFRRRFLREAQTAASLSHPNVVPIHAVEERDGLVFFVMTLVDGESLGERIRRQGPLPARDGLRMVQEVAWALAHAHARGIVHRDVKPDNILLERDGDRALVTDFGIAHAVGRHTPIDGVTLGTPAYMSPEQGRGEEPDARSDLYALGVTAWMTFTGHGPFPGPTATAYLMQHASAPVPRLADAAPRLPKRVAEAIDRCLAKEPAGRWPSAEALAQALSEQRERLPVVAAPLRAFLRDWDRVGAEFATVGTGALVSLILSAALSVVAWLYTGWDSFSISILRDIYLWAAGLMGGLAVERLVRLGQPARTLLRAGYGAESLSVAVERERAEEKPAADAGVDRTAAVTGTVATAVGAAAVYGLIETSSDALMITLAALSVVAPTLAVRSWWKVLMRRSADGLWNRLAAGWLGRSLLRVAAVGLEPVSRARVEDGEPTVVALGARARGAYAALPAAQRELFKDVPMLLDRLESEAMALRADSASQRADARFVEATSAMELLRLELMKLGTEPTAPGELTDAIERVREIGRHVDAMAEVRDLSDD
ncbi:MAG: serine/threonine protein kinase [Gemmatimonadetes bacterium]|nr:serine/threonine protein kinase [Gemmatimonadota bacterium]